MISYELTKFPFLLMMGTGLLTACSKEEGFSPEPDQDYRQEMRNFVIGLSKYAKQEKANFLIIPQNGIELVSQNEEPTGPPAEDYLNAMDGNGQEDLFFGYDGDDKATDPSETNRLVKYLNISKQGIRSWSAIIVLPPKTSAIPILGTKKEALYPLLQLKVN